MLSKLILIAIICMWFVCPYVPDKFKLVKRILKYLAIVMRFAVAFFGISYVVIHQVDLIETGLGFFRDKAQQTVATRDPNAIYQNGRIVGRVKGFKEIDGSCVFDMISNTSGLNPDLPFEYRTKKLKIVNIGRKTGTKYDATPSGAIEAHHDVIMDVFCKIID